MVHDERGAWGRVYDPYFRNLIIPDELIANEYKERFGNR
ncbi:Uncharacterised protein [Bordetella avium]|nr:Uncharacterised protein [Bordetella avium]